MGSSGSSRISFFYSTMYAGQEMPNFVHVEENVHVLRRCVTLPMDFTVSEYVLPKVAADEKKCVVVHRMPKTANQEAVGVVLKDFGVSAEINVVPRKAQIASYCQLHFKSQDAAEKFLEVFKNHDLAGKKYNKRDIVMKSWV